MRIIARNVKTSECPPALEPFLRQVFVTPMREYEVHSVATVDGISFVSIIDDTGSESRKPIWLFDILDKSMPEDWICNLFPEQGAVVIGPSFVAKDAESYSRLVERDPDITTQFWDRVRARRRKVVRTILLTDWDPIGTRAEPEGQDLYDPYIPDLLHLIEHNPSETDVFNYLWEVVNDKLGLIGDRAKTSLTAERILAAV